LGICEDSFERSTASRLEINVRYDYKPSFPEVKQDPNTYPTSTSRKPKFITNLQAKWYAGRYAYSSY